MGEIVIKALVIAPYPGLVELINQLDKQLTDFEITVEQGDLTRSLELLDKYKDNNFDLIISRGGTANLIRKHTSIPVLNMKISGYDILRILTLLKGYQSTTIGMIGFKDIIKSFESVSNLIDIDINYIEIQHENQVVENLKQAKKQGIRVIVGDAITVRLANEIGLQGVLITSSKESVLKTFEEAKQLYETLYKSNMKNKIYEKLLEDLDEGIVILDELGRIKFANEMFFKKLNILPNQDTNYSLFDQLPFLQDILEFKISDPAIIYQLAINNFDEVYEIKPQKTILAYEEVLHCIHFKQSAFTNDAASLQLIFSYKAKDNTPQYITSGILFEESFKIARERLNNNLPVSIIGEEGTGKRILVQTLTNLNENTIEIRFNNTSTRLFNQLMILMEQIDPNIIIHIRDIENTTPAQQLRFIEQIKSSKNNLVFSFTGEKTKLINNEFKLNKELHTMLGKDLIFLPTLRDRKSDLEGLIQTFIVQFNEQFGKQVVGIKPDILQSFLSHHWYGNLIELRNVLKQIIQKSDHEYIEEDALSILKQQYLSSNSRDGAYININQTLEEIEKEIIQIVLEEENMNQSKVAKRLGINRSTLWRKIKLIESLD